MPEEAGVGGGGGGGGEGGGGEYDRDNGKNEEGKKCWSNAGEQMEHDAEMAFDVRVAANRRKERIGGSGIGRGGTRHVRVPAAKISMDREDRALFVYDSCSCVIAVGV
eukprot:765748-Hanusia_phi.AAC.1